MKPLRIQSRLTLATVLPLTFFGILSLLVGSYALRQIPEDLVMQRQQALAQVAAAGVMGELEGYLQQLETLSDELSAYDGQPVQQQRLLEQRSLSLRAFSGGVLLLDNHGQVIAATTDVTAYQGQSFAFRDYFRQALNNQQPAFSTVIQDVPTGAVVVIAVPLRIHGRVPGVILGRFRLSAQPWAQNLNLLRTTQGGQAYLIDSASTIIYHPDPTRLGQSIQEEPELWRVVIAGQPRSILYQRNATTPRSIVTFAPLPGVAWGLLMEEPWDAIIAPAAPYQGAAVALFSLGLILTLISLGWSLQRITHPLNTLLSEAQRVAAGATFHPVTVTGPPDLQTLIEVFNQMVTRLEEQQETLRSYARQILMSQENERQRLSRDLHDETVQDLVGLAQRIELCRKALDQDPVAARQRLIELEELAQNTLTGVRRLSRNLRPFILEDLGLAVSLQALCRELALQLPQARVNYEIVGEESRLAPELELTAFRIVQEALNNIRKHAPQSQKVQVTLYYKSEGLLIMIEDDGPGFSLDNADARLREGRLGLTGMLERAQLFGGELKIDSEPGEGSRLRLELPPK